MSGPGVKSTQARFLFSFFIFFFRQGFLMTHYVLDDFEKFKNQQTILLVLREEIKQAPFNCRMRQSMVSTPEKTNLECWGGGDHERRPFHMRWALKGGQDFDR